MRIPDKSQLFDLLLMFACCMDSPSSCAVGFLQHITRGSHPQGKGCYQGLAIIIVIITNIIFLIIVTNLIIITTIT